MGISQLLTKIGLKTSSPYRSSIDVREMGVVINPTTGEAALTAAQGVQKAINRARETGLPVDFPVGTFPISTKLQLYTGSRSSVHPWLRLRGMNKLGSVLEDQVSSGPMLEFIDTSNNVQLTIENLGFSAGDSHKPTDYMTWFELRQTNSEFSNVDWSGGSNLRYRALGKFKDCFSIIFSNPYVHNCTGLGLEFDAPTVNSGNITFVGGNFEFIRAGMFFKGGATNNSLLMLGTKFKGSGTNTGLCDHLTVTPASDWTTGSTSITLPTGLDIIEATVLFLGGESTAQDIVIVESYSSTTGDTTLYQPLQNDYYASGAGADVEVFAGGRIGLATGRIAPCMDGSCVHLESVTTILWDAPAFHFSVPIYGSGDLPNVLLNDEGHFVFVSGNASLGGKLTVPYYDDTRNNTATGNDRALLRIINAAGGNVPGAIVEVPIVTPGSGYGTEVISSAASNARSIETDMDQEAIVFRRDSRVRRVAGNTIDVGMLAIQNSASASSLGTVQAKMEVFDENGASVGFAPLYDAIT